MFFNLTKMFPSAKALATEPPSSPMKDLNATNKDVTDEPQATMHTSETGKIGMEDLMDWSGDGLTHRALMQKRRSLPHRVKFFKPVKQSVQTKYVLPMRTTANINTPRILSNGSL